MTWVRHRCGSPRTHHEQVPHGGSQLAMTRSPTARPVTPSPTAITSPAGLVAEDGRHRLRQRAGPGGEVGVADPGGPDPDLDLSRPGADGLDVITDDDLVVVGRLEYRGPHDPPPAPGDLRRSPRIK